MKAPRTISPAALFRSARRCFALGALLALGLSNAPLEAQTIAPESSSSSATAAQAAKLQYVKVGANGAQAKNLADAGAVSVLDLAPGALLAVHGERAGWLDVETPGGFKVWIFGAYVTPADQAGLLKITGNDVRMRPLPSNSTDSYYLRQTLDKGVQVRYIQRHDPSKSLDQDWVQVYSPPGARAWVDKAQTVALDAKEQGSALWAQAVRATKAEVATSAAAVAAGSAESKIPQTAQATGDVKAAAQTLKQADDLLAIERKKHEQRLQPNYAAVKSAYEQVLAHASVGSLAESARNKLTLVDELSKAYQTEIDLEAERARRVAELSQREQAMEQARRRDSLEGRFDARGWLEKRQLPGQAEAVYVLSFAGASVAEVVCFSGRYDLEIFVGHELGVFGGQLRGALDGSLNEPSRPAQLDVRRIEVLAGRQFPPR